MQLTITDNKNDDYKEVKDLTAYQVVDIIEKSVKSGKWGTEEYFQFKFAKDMEWDTDCAKFIEDVAKEMASRDTIPGDGNNTNRSSIGVGFENPNSNMSGASISKEAWTYSPEVTYAYLIDRRDSNNKLITYGYQTGETVRPIPARVNDPKTMNIGFDYPEPEA